MTKEEKNRARAAKWQKENPERRKIIRDRWVAKNLEKMREMRKAWKLANPDKVRADCAAWMRNHPEVRISSEAKRRTAKTEAGGSFSKEEIDDLYLKQKGKCAICRESTKEKFHRDHIYPVALGGTSDISNIQLLCPTCNCKKGAKHPIDYAQQIGMLL